MNEVAAATKNIDIFVDSLISKTALHPASIALYFSKFCGLIPPLEYNMVVDACYEFGVDKITTQKFPDNLRGLYTDYDNNIEISVKDDEWEGGLSHTLLHELFEIIINRLNKKIPQPYELTEYKANLFAASVLMPRTSFLEFSFRANMDLQLIREKYYASYFSLLLRLHYIFAKRQLSYTGILAENKNVHNFKWRKPAIWNELKNFRIATTTLNRKDCFENYATLVEYLHMCHEAIMSQESEIKTTVTLENAGLIIKASPHVTNGMITTIAIQVIAQKDYELLAREVFKNHECSTICESILRKAS